LKFEKPAFVLNVAANGSRGDRRFAGVCVNRCNIRPICDVTDQAGVLLSRTVVFVQLTEERGQKQNGKDKECQ